MVYRFEDANELLTSKFLNMKKIYDEEPEFYDDLAYVFYESEFTRYIVSKLRERDLAEIKKIFDFVEDMLINGDREIVNLIGVAVVESIFFEKNFSELYPLILQFCGEKTKESFSDCINYRP